MKKSKKLMILGLSAATACVAATSAVSSFAWFATSGTVSASGMKVKASADEYLQIKYAYTGTSETPATPTYPSTATSYFDWTTSTNKNANSYNSVELNMASAKVLKPTSLIKELETDNKTIKTDFANGDTAHKWVSAIGTSSVDGSKKADDVYTDITSTADLGEKEDTTSANGYTLVVDYDIRLLNLGDTTTNYDLKAAIDWTTPSSSTTEGFKLRKAARVFVMIGDNYDETITSTEGTEGYEFSYTSGSWTAATTIKEDLHANASDKGVRVRTFFFFDGEDAEAKTVNVVTTEIYSYNITFSVTKHSGN